MLPEMINALYVLIFVSAVNAMLTAGVLALLWMRDEQK